MPTEFANAVKGYATVLLVVGGALTLMEIMLPLSRYTMVRRVRALGFWACYIVISVALSILFAQLWAHMGFTPWFTLSLGEWYSSGNIWAQIAGWTVVPFLVFAVGDFFFYWFHRMQHAVPFFWRFHEVHHSIEEMSAVNSYHHPTEGLFRIPFVVIPASMFFNTDSVALPAIVSVLHAAHAFYEHSCTRVGLGPLRFLVSDNKYHRIHHSLQPAHFHKNFGAFTPIWDVLFRTAHFPKRDEWPETGLADVPDPKTLGQYLAMPMRGGRDAVATKCSLVPND